MVSSLDILILYWFELLRNWNKNNSQITLTEIKSNNLGYRLMTESKVCSKEMPGKPNRPSLNSQRAEGEEDHQKCSPGGQGTSLRCECAPWLTILPWWHQRPGAVGVMCARAAAGKGHFCFNMVSFNNAGHLLCASGSLSVHEYFCEKHMHVERLKERERWERYNPISTHSHIYSHIRRQSSGPQEPDVIFLKQDMK